MNKLKKGTKMKKWIQNYIFELHEVLCLFLGLILLSSAMITGTLALTDYSQHATNRFEAVNVPYLVQLHKYEKNIHGSETTARVAGAEFYLYKVSEPDDIQIGVRYTTDSAGKIKIDDIDPGDYYFLETNPGYAYAFDENDGVRIDRYSFTIEKGTENIHVVHAFNRRISGSLTISKEVVNTDEGVSSDITTFEGPLTDGTGEIETTNEGTAPVESDTEGLNATEQPEEETAAPPNGEITGTTTNDPFAEIFEFTVTFSDSEAYEYSIDGDRPETLTSGETLRLKHGQTAVFPKLPVGVLYAVTESPVGGFNISGHGHQGNIVAEGNVAKFINTFIPIEPGNTEIQITKVVDGNPPAGDANKEFSFTLTIDGILQDFTLKAGETKTFPLPVGAVYEVTEADYLVDGYSQAITNGFGTATAGLIEVTVTNTFTGTEMLKISGEKTWDFTNLSAKMEQRDVLPKSITVHLKDGDRIVEVITVQPDNNGDWKYTFTAPKYRADGMSRIEYTIEEAPVNGFASEVDGLNIKNTYVAPVTFDAPMAEKQIDGDAPETAEQFRFILTANDKAPMPEGSGEGSAIVTIFGAGHIKFGNITYTNPGTYRYTIAEVTGSARGYSYDSSIYTLTVVIELQGNNLSVKSAEYVKTNDGKVYDKAVFANIYKEPDEPRSVNETLIISGEKSWNHGSNTNPSLPDGTPLTEDTSNIWLWITFITGSAVLLLITLLIWPKKRF